MRNLGTIKWSQNGRTISNPLQSQKQVSFSQSAMLSNQNFEVNNDDITASTVRDVDRLSLSDTPERRSNRSKIHQHFLRGHRGAVTCLAYSPLASGGGSAPCFSCLCSGSVDNSVRLWDLRAQRAALCILPPSRQDIEFQDPMEITSVAFHPLSATYNVDVAEPSVWDYSIYVSTNQSQLFEYDLRCIRKAHQSSSLSFSSPLSMLVGEPTVDYTHVLSSRDEINQLAVVSLPREQDGMLQSLIAVADDDGDVRLIETQTRQISTSADETTQPSTTTVFRHAGDGEVTVSQTVDDAHEEETPSQEDVAMVTSVAFRPQLHQQQRNVGKGGGSNKAPNRTTMFASAGTDCTVKLWDINQPAKALSSYLVPRNDLSANQICNPPMVHSVSWSSTGRLLATGLGDGSCLIFRIADNFMKKTTSLYPTTRLTGGHSSAVACVHFPSIIGGSFTDQKTTEDRLLLSAGNDGDILFWDIGWEISGPDRTTLNPAAYLSGLETDTEHSDRKCSNGNRGKKPSSNKKKNRSSKSGKAVSERDETRHAVVLLGVPHEKKPNWITTNPIFLGSDNCSFSIYVADISNDITAYTMPLR